MTSRRSRRESSTPPSSQKASEDELGFRRGHLYVPVRPTEQFGADARAVFIAFNLHQHDDPFQVTGRCYPEEVDGLDPMEVVAEDAVEIKLEEDSGYLELFAPPDGGKPGKYKVEIHLGWWRSMRPA